MQSAEIEKLVSGMAEEILQGTDRLLSGGQSS